MIFFKNTAKVGLLIWWFSCAQGELEWKPKVQREGLRLEPEDNESSNSTKMNSWILELAIQFVRLNQGVRTELSELQAEPHK